MDKREFDPNDESQIVLSVLDKVSKNMGSKFYAKAHGLLKGKSEQLKHPIFINLNAKKLEKAIWKRFKRLKALLLAKMKFL